jgi:hypothetical protein
MLFRVYIYTTHTRNNIPRYVKTTFHNKTKPIQMTCQKIQFSFIVLTFSLFFTPLSMSAQGYGMAAGVRVGNGIGVTFQQQVALNTSIEGILQRETKSGYSDVTLNVLYEKHQNILTKGLNIYAGGGLYYTFLEDRTNLIAKPTNPYGVAGIVGAELTIAKFNVAIDFKPMIKVGGGGEGIKGFQIPTAFSVRYVLAGRYFKDDKWKFWKNWGKKK